MKRNYYEKLSEITAQYEKGLITRIEALDKIADVYAAAVNGIRELCVSLFGHADGTDANGMLASVTHAATVAMRKVVKIGDGDLT